MNAAPSQGLPSSSHSIPSSASGAEVITPETTESNLLMMNRSHDVFSSPQPWQHMTRTIAHYERLEQIGLGTYGQVYRAICKDTGRMVAMKKMRIMSTAGGAGKSGGGPVSTGMPLQLIREIKILKQLQHPNLLQMIEVVTSKGVEHLDPEDPIPPSSSSEKNKDKSDTNEDAENDERYKAAMERERFKGNLFLVLEYMTHDLTGLMDVAYQFTPVQMKCIMSQLFQALKFMHENKYVHRDIKSSNILLDSFFRLKLADFGLARSLEPPLLDQMESSSTTISSSYSNTQQDLTNKVITLWYRPPEILLGTVRYGCAVDVWSAGCILAELWTGKPLATGKTELDQLKLLADLTGTPDNETWDYLMSLKKSRSLLPTITSTATEWSGSGQRPSKLQEKYGPKSSKKANRQIPESALNLLEKLLEWDPRKRLTAANALQNRYFWTQPVAPENPAELGRIDVAVDGHFHEFQTKQKRKQAKTHAEQVREQALRDGATAEAASELFDETYKGIMKQIAQKGISDTLDKKPVPVDVEPDGEKKVYTREDITNDLARQEESRLRHGGSKDEKRDRRKDDDRRRDRKHRRGDGSLDDDEQHRRDKKKRSSSDKSEDGHKEKRRSSIDDQKRDHRSDKEGRTGRKDSIDNTSNFDDKVDTGSQKTSGKHHRRDHKKDRKSRRSEETRSSEKDRHDRRLYEKHSHHRSGRDVMDRNHTDGYQRAPPDVAPGRNDPQFDRGRLGDLGPDNDRHRFEGPRGGDGGPIYDDYNPKGRREVPVYGDYRSNDRHSGGGGHQSHAKWELDRPSGIDPYGPSTRRDRDGYGPSQQQRRDFGPAGPLPYGRDRDGPTSRSDYGPPAGVSQRGARPRDDSAGRPLRDRDGGGPRGDLGMTGQRRGDHDGPFYGGDDPFYRRDGPTRGGDVGPSRSYRNNEGGSRDGPSGRRHDRDR
jgi:cyclin-dependent kinase 12/13